MLNLICILQLEGNRMATARVTCQVFTNKLMGTVLGELMKREPGSVLAVGNPGSVPAQPFIACKFIASVIQNVT